MKYTFTRLNGEPIINTFIGTSENSIDGDGMYSGYITTRAGTFCIGVYCYTPEAATDALDAFLKAHAE